MKQVTLLIAQTLFLLTAWDAKTQTQTQTTLPANIDPANNTPVVWLTPDNYNSGVWINRITTPGSAGHFTQPWTGPNVIKIPPFTTISQFHPAVMFGGINRDNAPYRLMSDSMIGISSNDAFTIILVHKRTDRGTWDQYNILNYGNQGDYADPYNVRYPDMSDRLTTGWTEQARSLGTVPFNTLQLVTIDNNNGGTGNSGLNGIVWYLGGELKGSTYTAVGGSANTAGNGEIGIHDYKIVIGGCHFRNLISTGGASFIGYVQEVIILKRPRRSAPFLNAMDRNKIHSYLAVKYGIPLKNCDYIASDGKTCVWNQTRNSGYNHHIFGIARDDAYGLYQKQGECADNSLFTAFVGDNVANLNSSNLSGQLDNNVYVLFGSNGVDLQVCTEIRNPADQYVAAGSSQKLNYRRDLVYKVQSTTSRASQKVKLKPSNGSFIDEYMLISKDSTFPVNATEVRLFRGSVIEKEFETGVDYYISFAGRTTLAGQGPGGVESNLQLWLRADDPMNIVTESLIGGRDKLLGYPDAPVGTWLPAVSEWKDVLRGHTYSYLAAGTNDVHKEPVYQPTNYMMNFHPAVRFWGNDMNYSAYLGNNKGLRKTKFPTNDKHSAFFVVNNDFGTSAWFYTMMFGSANSSSYRGPGYGVQRQSNGDIVGRLRTNLDVDSAVHGTKPLFTPGTTSILGYHHEALGRNFGDRFAIRWRFNGLEDYQDGTSPYARNADFGLDQASMLGIGFQHNRVIQGVMSEVIMYDGELLADSLRMIESYLALKYGITLTPDDQPRRKFDYMFSDREMLWNGTAGANSLWDMYYHRLAAIIRDDEARLYNRQSHSTNVGSILHIGVAGTRLGSQVDLGNFAYDKEAVMWGDDNGAGTYPVAGLCGDFEEIFLRKWLVHKKTHNGRPLRLLVGAEDNSGNRLGERSHGATVEDSVLFSKLAAGNDVYLIVADDPAKLTPGNPLFGQFRAVVPMHHVDGEHQCACTFTDDTLFVTFGYTENGGNIASDAMFGSVKVFDWAQWTRQDYGAGVASLTRGPADLGDNVRIAGTSIRYQNGIRAPRYFPSATHTPVANSLSLQRRDGALDSRVSVTVEFEEPVRLEFSIFDLDGYAGRFERVAISGMRGTATIAPELSHACDPAAAHYRINGNAAVATVMEKLSPGSREGQLNVAFTKGVTRVEIEYSVTNRTPLSQTAGNLIISPLRLRPSPPPPPVNEDGMSFIKGVGRREIALCEPVEYVFHIGNVNCDATYVHFSDTLPAKMTWQPGGVIPDSLNAQQNPHIRLNSYAGSRILRIDSLFVPGGSTLKLAAVALLDSDAVSPGMSETFHNHARIEYEQYVNNAPAVRVLQSSDRETLEAETPFRVEWREQQLAVQSTVSTLESFYRVEGDVRVTVTLNNPNPSPVTAAGLHVLFNEEFSYVNGSFATSSNITDAVITTMSAPYVAQPDAIFPNADGSIPYDRSLQPDTTNPSDATRPSAPTADAPLRQPQTGICSGRRRTSAPDTPGQVSQTLPDAWAGHTQSGSSDTPGQVSQTHPDAWAGHTQSGGSDTYGQVSQTHSDAWAGHIRTGGSDTHGHTGRTYPDAWAEHTQTNASDTHGQVDLIYTNGLAEHTQVSGSNTPGQVSQTHPDAWVEHTQMNASDTPGQVSQTHPDAWAGHTQSGGSDTPGQVSQTHPDAWAEHTQMNASNTPGQVSRTHPNARIEFARTNASGSRERTRRVRVNEHAGFARTNTPGSRERTRRVRPNEHVEHTNLSPTMATRVLAGNTEQPLWIAGDVTGASGFTIPPGTSTLTFKLRAPGFADLAYRLDQHNQPTNQVAELELHYQVISETNNPCITRSLIDVSGTRRLPYKLLYAGDDRATIFAGTSVKIPVLANDFHETSCTPLLTLTGRPSRGNAVLVNDTLHYTPQPNALGPDTATYRLDCGGGDTVSAHVYLLINSIPDNLNSVSCHVTPPPTALDFQRKAVSDTTVYDRATPFVGDLDGDGRPEVILPGNPGGPSAEAYATHYLILNDSLQHLRTIAMTDPQDSIPVRHGMSFLIADTDGDGHGEILYATHRRRLHCYSYRDNVERWATPAGSYEAKSPSSDGHESPGPTIADLDGDGYAEILIGNKIFAGESGIELLELPAGGRGASVGEPHACLPVFADINSDGIQEIVAGNTVYTVTIARRSGKAGNTAAILARAPHALPDGFTSVADIDLDGDPDVIVTTAAEATAAAHKTLLYVWDGNTPTLIGDTLRIDSKNSRISRACAGDFVEAGRPDIAFAHSGTLADRGTLEAFRYDPATNALVPLWQRETTDSVGTTPPMLFDFDGDGIQEIVHRDETHLHLLSGTDGLSRSSHPHRSAAQPVIVDLDRDGQADILLVGDTGAIHNRRHTRLLRYANLPGGGSRWASARSVWNQHACQPLHINDDLSLPPYPPTPAMTFPGADGRTGTPDDLRPFNAFLQQQSRRDSLGLVRWPAPDLHPIAEGSAIRISGDTVHVTVAIHNQGDAPFRPPLYATLYNHNGIAAANSLTVDTLTDILPAGDTVRITATYLTRDPVIHLTVRVNDRNANFPHSGPNTECEESNNERILFNTTYRLYMKKRASIDGIPDNGVYANPVAVLGNDTIQYRITAVNMAPHAGSIIIRDTLPPYLRYRPGTARPGTAAAFSHDSTALAPGTPRRDILTWTLNHIPPARDTLVRYAASPEAGACASQPLFINRAWITVNNRTVETDSSVYHQGAGIALLTFAATCGGAIYNAHPQALDYRSSPQPGILIVPDDGYAFAGWSHAAYRSLRGETIPSRSGIRHYDTLSILGDVELTACFEPIRYPVHYFLHGGENAPANPREYTIHSSTHTLEAPRKTDDIFIGWTGSNGAIPQQRLTIPIGSTGALTYYANYLHSGRETSPPPPPPSDRPDDLWGTPGELHIRTSRTGSIARIYTPDGVLRGIHPILSPGLTRIKLPRGLYLVTLNNRLAQKVRIE